jgi:hypothetical protein
VLYLTPSSAMAKLQAKKLVIVDEDFGANEIGVVML